MQNIYRYKTKRIRFKKIENPIKKRIDIVSMSIITLFLGVIVGSLVLQMSENTAQNYIINFVNQVFQAYSKPFQSVFGYLYLSFLTVQIAVFLSAFSCVGTPIILTIIFSNGFVFGCVSAYLYQLFGVFGLVINLLVFLLPQLSQSVMLLLLATKSMRFSFNLFKGVFLKKSDVYLKINEYIKYFLYSNIALIILCLVCAVTVSIFASMFLNDMATF